MKKILSLALALAMIGTALTGCGSKDAATKTPAENTQQTAPVQQEQSQTEKALALINTFATGDTDPPQPVGGWLHPAQSGIRHRCGCLYRFRGISRIRRCENHCEQHPCF